MMNPSPTRLAIPARLLVLVVGLALGLACAEASAPGARELTDRQIADAVELRYTLADAIDADDVDVAVNDGIVELTGTVDDLLAKDRAAVLATSIRGVRAVSNRLRVVPVVRSDYAIRSDVTVALISDPAADSYEIDVAVDDGVVTLTGKVQSWQEEQLAERIAKGVRGVKEVKNDISLVLVDERDDAEIKADIEARLRWDAYVDHWGVHVAVQDGAVTLTGFVGAASEKHRAVADAWVSGVSSVDGSGLRVEAWARDPQRRKTAYPDVADDEITAAIERALLYDPRVHGFEVTPRVTGGYVTLSGLVDNLRAKHAAEQVANRTVGVFRVTNLIKVRSEEAPPDDEIADDVRDALRANPFVWSRDVQVAVDDGVVTLSGRVDNFLEKIEAEEVAATVRGCRRILNLLVVEGFGPGYAYDYELWPVLPYSPSWEAYLPEEPARSDLAISLDIENRLAWSPHVDERNVVVTVIDGVATLTGTVENRRARLNATTKAYEGGAIAVINQLEVAD